jgi:tetratricopeptide (TPR) repeat protein
MNNLAMAYRAAGTLELAVPLMKETLKLTRSIRGGDHHDTLTSINNLAAAYVDDGNIELALPLMREAAVEIETRRFQHIYAERIVNNLIRSQEFLKQFDQAEPWRRKWLTVVKSQSGVDSLGYAGELAGLGLNLLQRQKWTDAEAVLHDCLEIRRKEQADDPTTFDTQSMLGGALLGQKKYADAEPLLLAGYEGLKNNEQVMASQSKSSLIEHRLVDLYEATGKRDDAAGWRKEFEATEAAAELSPKP